MGRNIFSSGSLNSSEKPGSRELVRVCLATGFASAVLWMVGPLVPLLLVSLDVSPGLLGMVVGFSTLGSLILAVPGGFLINAWGSRLMMQRSGLLFTFSCILIAVFPSVAGLFIGLFFLEIGKLLFILGAQSHVANLGEGRDANHDFGWYGTSVAIGQMAGPASAGFLIDTAGYQTAWAFAAVFMAANVLIFPRMLNHGKIKKAENISQGEGNEKPKGFRHFLSVYALIAIISSFAVIFADGARQTFFPVLLTQFGYSASVIGIYMSLRALVSVAVRFFMAWIVRTSGGRFPALIMSIVILSIGIATTPFCKTHILLIFNAILSGIGTGLAFPLSIATVSESVKPEDRGVAMGIRLTGNRLAQLINPVFFGVIAQAYNLGASFISGGLLLLGAAVPIFLWWRGEKKHLKADSGI